MASAGLGFIFLLCSCAFEPRDAYAFTVDGTTYPDTLAGVTVTMDETLYAPTYATGSFESQTWYSLHLTTSGVSGNASSWFYSEPNSVSNPWWFYVSNTQSLQSAGTNGQRYGYMGNVSNAGWWGLNSGVSAPTITFYDYPGDTLLTNSLFIMWIVGNSDYFERYGTEVWNGGHASASNGVIAYSYSSSNISPIVRIYSSSNQETWTLVQSYTPGPGTQAGTYNVTTANYYRVDFVYTLNGATQNPETYYVGYVSPSSVNLPIFNSYLYTASAHQLLVKYSTSGAKPGSVTLYLSTDDGQTYRQVGFTNTISEDGGTYNAYFTIDAAGLYTVIAQVSGGQTETVIGQIDYSETSSDWNEIWNDGLQNLNPIFQTFRDLFSTLFAWIPADLRSFLLGLILVLIVLGIVSRVV